MILRRIFPLLVISAILGGSEANLWSQCVAWNYSYSPEIKCDYMEYFNLPTRATLICKPRLVSIKSPGDYYQEPSPNEFGVVPRTAEDNNRISQYAKLFLKDEYICDSVTEHFNSYIVFIDSSMEHGHNPEHSSFADSSRREFFGKFLVGKDLIFISGWYDKFAFAYINVETDSIDIAIAAAKKCLKIAVPPLADFEKFEYEIKRSDVRRLDSLTAKQSPILDVRQDIFYRFVGEDAIVFNIFKRVVAIIPAPGQASQNILSTKSYWVVEVCQFFEKSYIPSWVDKIK